jgi:hypothetical protein
VDSGPDAGKPWSARAVEIIRPPAGDDLEVDSGGYLPDKERGDEPVDDRG